MAITSVETIRLEIPDTIMNLSIFGSYGRGDSDCYSDLDVLAIVKDGSGVTPEQPVADHIRQFFPSTPNIAFYGERKMHSMFAHGDLFAWHLYLESHSLPGFTNLMEQFGRPADYKTALEDVSGLLDILSESSEKLTSNDNSMTFEFGVFYVCARNIAMSASYMLKDRVDFGRYSPFHLPMVEFPMSKDCYDVAMRCRMSSTRGLPPPDLSLVAIDEIAATLPRWALSIENELR